MHSWNQYTQQPADARGVESLGHLVDLSAALADTATQFPRVVLFIHTPTRSVWKSHLLHTQYLVLSTFLISAILMSV